MSRNNNAQRKSVAPPCAHCRNLGLPTNHALRQSADPKSPVVCPVLKSTKCLKCGDLGHTASHCKKGADEEAAQLRNQALAERMYRVNSRAIQQNKAAASAPTAPVRSKTGGLFAALDDSDEEANTLRISNKKAKKAAKAQAATDAAQAAAKAIVSSREATRYLSALLGVGKKTNTASVAVTGTMTLTKQSLSQMIASAPNPIKVYKRWTDAEDAEESDDEDDMSCFSDGDSYRNR
jgi:hypothetical protein